MADPKMMAPKQAQPQGPAAPSEKPARKGRKVLWFETTQGGVRFENSKLGVKRTVSMNDPSKSVLEMEMVPGGVLVTYAKDKDEYGVKLVPAANLKDVELDPEDA